MGLRDYLVKRVLQAIPVVLCVIVVNFLVIHAAPGDIALYYVGHESPSPEEIAAVRKEFGLDQPLWTQFVLYMEKLTRLDFGISWSHKAPVIAVISERVPATLLLTFTSLVLSLAIGVVLGAIAARKPGSKFDFASSMSLLILYSTPVFWGGLMLMLVFAVSLHVLPTSGILGTENLTGWSYYLDLLRHLFLPAVTLALFSMMGLHFRVTRSSIIEVIREDFITTAKAVGYDDNTVFMKHALRNALLPVVTVVGYEMGFLFSGATITETVFSWPGIGRLIFDAIASRDFPLLMGCYIIASLCVVGASLATDVLYTFLDPRVKLE